MALSKRWLVAKAKSVLPWIVAVAALYWVFKKVPWEEVATYARQVDVTRFLLASAVLLVLNCAADTLAMYYTFGWFGCRLPYRELFVVRAATYLLAVIQYYVGQAAILTYLHQRRAVPFSRAAGWILFISGINLGVLVLLAGVGLSIGDARTPWLQWISVGIAVGSVLYGLLLRARPHALASIRIFAPLFEMGIVGHLKATLVRIPHVLVLIVWHYMALRMFGVNVPWFTALVLLPAVFFAAALPISIQGAGVSQVVALYFFQSYAPGKGAVIAYSIAMMAVSLVVQLTMGLAFLPAGRRLGMEPETIDADAAIAEEAASATATANGSLATGAPLDDPMARPALESAEAPR